MLKFVATRPGTSVKMIEDHYGHVLGDMGDDAVGEVYVMEAHAAGGATRLL